MNHLRYSWKTLLSVGAVLGLACALAGHAQSLPEGPGSALVQRTCTSCHSIATVTSQRLSQSGWEATVENMISRGAQATPDEQTQIVDYLAKNFAPSTSTPTNNAAAGSGRASRRPVHTQPAVAPLDASQVAQAKGLIQSNGCLSCHRIGGEGSFAGPYLGDAGASQSIEQIRTALVSPSKELAPQNRSVRLVTKDGKTVEGKLLNQDAFSVQIIEASGQLESFEKANLQNFTIVTENSMPSYASKISDQDITLLSHYLATQTGTSQQ